MESKLRKAYMRTMAPEIMKKGPFTKCKLSWLLHLFCTDSPLSFSLSLFSPSFAVSDVFMYGFVLHEILSGTGGDSRNLGEEFEKILKEEYAVAVRFFHPHLRSFWLMCSLVRSVMWFASLRNSMPNTWVKNMEFLSVLLQGYIFSLILLLLCFFFL